VAKENPHSQVHALIIDTDVLMWVHRGLPAAASFINAIPVQERNLSAISYLELLYGSRDSGELKNIQKMVHELFAEVIPVTENITLFALNLMRSFVLAHRPDPSDALIGATALIRQETLATGNHKDFRFIPGLPLRTFRP